MKAFMNLRISKKLIVAFLVVAVIAGAIGAVGILNLRNINEDYGNLFEQYGVALGDIAVASTYYQLERNYLRQALAAPENIEKLQQNMKDCEKKIDDSLAHFESLIESEDMRDKYNNMKALIAKYRSFLDEVIPYIKVHNMSLANEITNNDGAPIAVELNQAVEDILNTKISQGQQLAAEYSASTMQTILTMLAIVFIAMVLAIVLGIIIARNISTPIKKMVSAAEKIATGDLNVNIEVKTKEEIGTLQRAFKKMVNNTNDVISNINEAANQVTSEANQVSESSVALAEGATEQASSIEELSASVEEIASQTKLNANNAIEANQLAEKTKVNAVHGNEQMKVMLKAMDEINESSNKISTIIKVIDDIAFQTNILALNAAVEAARAGQHGKGFAVVAEEVKNLAARSASAAKETTGMIEDSIKKVEGGTKIANETALALRMIVEDIEKAAALINDISGASNEQAMGIEQISQGLAQVSTVVQANSATSEEAAAASEELSAQAKVLREQVSRFRLRKNTRNYDHFDEMDEADEMLADALA
jgi:methyl-accepting chemotaxis protein